MSSGIDGLEFTGSSLLRDALSTVKREVRQREDHSGASVVDEKERV